MRRSGPWSRASAVAAMLLSLAALSCSKPQQQAAAGDAAPPTSVAPVVASVAAPSASGSAATDPADPRVASASPADRPMAPLKLVVKGPPAPPDKGDFELAVDIVAGEPLPVPLMLRIDLPAGARLTKGTAQDTVTVQQAGTLTRQYTIHLDAPLTAPIVVVGETRTDAGTVGLHAERKYPAAGIAPAASRPAAPAR